MDASIFFSSSPSFSVPMGVCDPSFVSRMTRPMRKRRAVSD